MIENKIEVGDYIRTVDGIKRIVKINTGDRKTIFGQYRLDKPYKGSYSIAEKNILEHNKDIKKIIKIGDYVNRYEVIPVFGYDEDGNDKDGLGICEVDDDYAYYTYLEDIDIKSIVTKEQFERDEYKVGG